MRARLPTPHILTLLTCLVLLASPGAPALAGPNAGETSLLSPVFQTAEGRVVARVYFTSLDDLNRLAASLDVWEVHHAEGYLVALLTPAQSTELEQAGYRIEIDAVKTALLSGVQPALPGQVSGIPGYPCYRTVEETYDSLAQLAASHPNLAQWIDIGDSWEKVIPGGSTGYDLYALVLTNTAIPGPKPAFFLMGAIHAREYATAELAARFAEGLVAAYGFEADATWLLDHFEVHVLPQANPDGRKIAETGVWWRKNVDRDDGCSNSNQWGTDLNRNSSFMWGLNDSASPFPCAETYRGSGPASEPETQAIQDYAAAIFPDQRGPEDGDAAPEESSGVFITLHSYWPLVLFPWGWGAQPAPNHTQLETLGRKFGYFTGYPVCQSGEPGCIYLTSGSTDDWVYGELGVAAYTFEVGHAFFESCSEFEQMLLPENLPALRYALKATRRPYQDPAGPETLGLSLEASTLVPGIPAILSAVADDTRYHSGGWGNEPVQPVVASRYSIDAPSWTGAATYPVEAADGAFDNPVETLEAVIDTSFFVEGRHLIFVESQDAAGNWGVPSAIFLTVESRDYLPGLSPLTASAEADPGETLTYNFQVNNLGLLADSYQIEASGYQWVTGWEPKATGPLESGGSEALVVTVNVPADTQGGEVDTVQLTAISQGETGRTAAASVTTTVRLPYNLALSPVTPTLSAQPGASVMHTVLLTNTGRFRDTYSFSLEANDWETSAQLPVAEVDRGGTVPLFVTVKVPSGVPEHGTDTVEVRVSSQNDPQISRMAVLTTAARWFNLFFPLAGR